jgi:hypothetical protein
MGSTCATTAGNFRQGVGRLGTPRHVTPGCVHNGGCETRMCVCVCAREGGGSGGHVSVVLMLLCVKGPSPTTHIKWPVPTW